MVTRLKAEGKTPGYIADLMKTVKSWLRYNGLTLTRRVKISNSTATPTIENKQVPLQEELTKILKGFSARVRAAKALLG